MGVSNINKILKIAVITLIVVSFCTACGVSEKRDKSWKNGCEPAIQNLDLTGTWQTGSTYGAIEISNFSWKEFDVFVPSMGEMHFVLIDPVIKGVLRYQESNGRYAAIQLIGEEVWVQIMEYYYPTDDVALPNGNRFDCEISGIACKIDFHILPKLQT